MSSTIVAQATPSGFGGIGIVRVSGPLVPTIAQSLLKKLPIPKRAEYLSFCDKNNELIDEGIALYFKAPHSFTGEDVLELQGHGGPLIIQSLVTEVVNLGARIARPGEFSERAFLNNKLDLVQAEAIIDLIHANSEQAAKSAIRSLQGEFSKEIHYLIEQFIHLRMQMEAQIDFPDEEIPIQQENKIQESLNHLTEALNKLLQKAKTGALLSEGAKIVILGRPNAGKSSLLNVLSGYDAAIVTDIPGTTRDLLKESINIDGLILHLVDTAGLRSSEDLVEQQGIKRAVEEWQKADHIIFMLDASVMQETQLEKTELAEIVSQETDSKDTESKEEPVSKKTESYVTDPRHLFPEWQEQFCKGIPITVICNKIDLVSLPPCIKKMPDYTMIQLSTKTQAGLELLRHHLKECFQFSLGSEGIFAARTRHVNALEVCKAHVLRAKQHFTSLAGAELVTEELRLGQLALDEITGKFSSDDLLGKIFSEFCIGK